MSGMDNKYIVSCLLFFLSPSRVSRFCECFSGLPLAVNMSYPQQKVHWKGISNHHKWVLWSPLWPLASICLCSLWHSMGKEAAVTSFLFPPILTAPGRARREAGARVVPSSLTAAAPAAALHPTGAKLLDAALWNQGNGEIGALQHFVSIYKLCLSCFLANIISKGTSSSSLLKYTFLSGIRIKNFSHKANAP